MRKEEVPQDAGLLDEWRRVQYAVDRDEAYVAVPSAGFEPANVANALAWDLVRKRVDEAREQCALGEASPLAFHMARRQMDPALLARYAGLARRKVKRHLTPKGFARLDAAALERYADILDISLEELSRVS